MAPTHKRLAALRMAAISPKYERTFTATLPAFLRVDEAGELRIIITQMLIFCSVTYDTAQIRALGHDPIRLTSLGFRPRADTLPGLVEVTL